MSLTLRQATPADVPRCAEIGFDAFNLIAREHDFPSDMPSLQVAAESFTNWIGSPGHYVLVAELDGSVVASIVLDERSPICGLGPVTVHPGMQNNTLGRQLMEAGLQRAAERGSPGVRLVQAGYHTRSLCLYAKVGFEVREPLVSMTGPPLALQVPGCHVRPASEGDLAAADDLCRRVHGHDRGGELRDAIGAGSALVVLRDQGLSGYATSLGFGGHAVGETNEDLMALIGAAQEFLGQGFLVPTRNGELFRWCLGHGLRAVQPLTLMSAGFYNEPRKPFLPSISY